MWQAVKKIDIKFYKVSDCKQYYANLHLSRNKFIVVELYSGKENNICILINFIIITEEYAFSPSLMARQIIFFFMCLLISNVTNDA